jgi:uncharacterized phage protein (TIGR01671 family)
MTNKTFRAWTGEKMVYFSLFGTDEGYHIQTEENLDGYPIMQHTGLKDQNGKAIYEDDIIDWGDNFNSIIKYNTEEAQFEMQEIGIVKGEYEARTHVMTAYTGRPIVLGNIYENANLLNDDRSELG